MRLVHSKKKKKRFHIIQCEMFAIFVIFWNIIIIFKFSKSFQNIYIKNKSKQKPVNQKTKLPTLNFFDLFFFFSVVKNVILIHKPDWFEWLLDNMLLHLWERNMYTLSSSYSLTFNTSMAARKNL